MSHFTFGFRKKSICANMKWLTLTCCCVYLVVLLSASTVEGVECYLCVHTGCEDAFKNNSAVSTVTCHGACKKTKLDTMVTRSCVPMLTKNHCEEKDDKTTCYCTGHLCNTGTRAAALCHLMAVLAVVPRLGLHL